MSQPLYVVRFSTCALTRAHSSSHHQRSAPRRSRILTILCEKLPEVHGDHHPFGEAGPVAPQADVHGAGAGLAVHADEVERVAGEVVPVPTLTLVCRKS